MLVIRRLFLCGGLAVWLGSPAAAEIRVGGRILDPLGRPAPEVGVALVPLAGPEEARTLRLAGQAFPKPQAEGRTDAGGRFVLKAPTPGFWRVIAKAEGFLPMEERLFPLLADTEVPALELERASEVRLRVLANGKPVEGALVQAEPPFAGADRAAFQLARWHPAPRLGRTAEDGTLTLATSRGEVLDLSAVAPGLPEKWLRRSEAAAVEIVLDAGCPRVVETVDAKGRPVPGAWIASQAWELGATDETGRLVVPAPCRDSLPITAEAADGRSARGELRPLPPDKPPVAARLALLPPERWSGKTLVDESRKPIAGAWVWLEESPARFSRTDPRGSYALALPGARTAQVPRVHAAAAGFLPALPAALDDGAAKRAPTLLLRPAAALQGTVVDSRGGPVAEAQIEAELAADFPGHPSAQASSDAQGRFRLEVTPDGYRVRISHPHWVPQTLRVGPVAETAARPPLRIVLQAGGRARGKIQDPEGRPVPGAEVILTASTERKAWRRSFHRDLDRLNYPSAVAATTDRDGRFQLEHIPREAFDLWVNQAGFSPLMVRGQALSDPTGTTDLGTLTLEPGIVLDGTVVDAQGHPLAGATVAARPPNSFPLSGDPPAPDSTRTDAVGRFALRGLPPAEALEIFAWRPGYRREALPRLEPPVHGPLRLTLHRLGRVRGTVEDERGSPVAGATIRFSPRDRPMEPPQERPPSDARGGFLLDDVAPGSIAVSVEAEGYLPAEPLLLEVPEGQELADVEARLRHGATIAGTVTDAAGKPVVGAQVSLPGRDLPQAGWLTPPRRASTDGDGHYLLRGVAEGPGSVVAERPGLARAARDLEVRPGLNSVDLQLGNGLILAGRVADEAGHPLGDAFLLLNGAKFEGTASLADGTFRFTGLPAGPYELGVEKPAYAETRQEVTLGDSSREDVQIVLKAAGATIQGRILGLDAAELARLRVSANPAALATAGSSGAVTTAGSYRIPGLAEGGWTVFAGLENGRSLQKVVTIPGGAHEVALDLDFRGDLTLSGKVLLAGQPAAQAWVEVKSNAPGGDGRQLSATTNVEGRFRFERLPAARYEVTARRDAAFGSTQETVELAADEDIELELPAAGLRGRTVDAGTDSPLAGTEVELRRVEAQPRPADWGDLATAQADGRGEFAFSGLTAGTYELIARKSGYANATARVEIQGEDAAPLRLALSPAEGLVVDVRGPAALPPSEVRVALLDDAGQIVVHSRLMTGENGRVRIANAPEGHFRLLLAAPGAATASLPVTVPSPPLDVALAPAADLTVQVPALAEGNDTAVLTLLRPEGELFRSMSWSGVQQAWPLEHGSARIDDLPAGTWQIRVNSSQGKSWQGTVTLSAGQAASRELR